MPILSIPSLTRSLKLKMFEHNQQLRDTQTERKTDIVTTRLNQPRADAVKSQAKNKGKLKYIYFIKSC